ncbi:MAG: 1-deoxy-D-xylulose-5-phosphate synthase [Muribaculaceae bacterium]|nr:1-deoxy-D-xylulose-5-phosphate synthase [Muribaculaceae bacterium]
MDLTAIHSPADIRRMDMNQLKALAASLRRPLLDKLSAHGGHVGPNLGMVEAIIALHYVFDTPDDKIVFDVSHQTYPHKMLTGRMEAFTDPAHYDDVTGYTNPSESPYDLFSLGHTSSAVALASGLAKARDLAGGTENVVAVIGDGSLSGGVAFEGLDYGATLGSNFIVVVNDNDMSIAENHGGIYADLHLLRNTNGTADNNIFRAMGYAYRYVHYGNDLPSLIKAFSDVKDIKYPVVVHINTMKGMGLPVAEAHKERFHFSGPFDLKSGSPLASAPSGTEPEDYADIFADHFLKEIRNRHDLVAITAGTPGVIGFGPGRRREAGRQFVDVGIAEQQAVAMASGLAKGGALSNIPGLTVLAPTCREEYLAMIRWAQDERECPVVIRVPGGPVISNPSVALLDDYSAPAYDIVSRGAEDGIALIGAGTFLPVVQEAAKILAAKGIDATVINPRSVSHLDETTLSALKACKGIITAEDGIVDGGYGQKIASYFGRDAVKVVNLGLPREFRNRYNPSELQKECGLTPGQIADTAMSLME